MNQASHSPKWVQPQLIRLKGYIRQPVGVQRICRRFSKFAYTDVCGYMGKCLLTSCERVIQKKTLNPFDVNTIQLDALLQHNNSKNINTTSELHENSN